MTAPTPPSGARPPAGGGPVRPPTQTSLGPGRWGSAAMPVETASNFRAVLVRLWHRLGPERPLLVLTSTLTLISVVMLVVGPRILGEATDIIVRGVLSGAGIDHDALRGTLGLALGLYVGAWVLSYTQAWILAGVVQRTMYRLRSDVEDKLHRLPLAYLDNTPRGDLMSRVTNDLDNVAQSFQQTTSQLLTNLLTLVGVFVMMVSISPLLAGVVIVTVPTTLWAMRAIARRARPRFIAQWAHTGALNAQVEEAFTGHAIVKAYGRQPAVEARFSATNDQLYEAGFRAQLISGSMAPVTMFLGNVQYVLIAVVGGLRVQAGAISIGDVQAFVQYSRQFSQPLSHVAGMINLLQSGIASLERVFELLDAPEETPDPPAPAERAPVRGRVVFEDVWFSYDPDRSLIEDFNLVVEPGRTVAIVGHTGAGKTTIVNLLMRFYDPQRGRIVIDGVDIAAVPRALHRSRIGMVLQDTWLFGGTIRDNIAYGRPGATTEEIVAAARAAYVDRFVHALPDGYDTVINEEGSNLSAGERQLITIARAFLADPPILVLDEATSSVDTRTEMLVQEAMAALRADRTSFVIAHRLSTIRGADTILVMDHGRVVEQGTHDELVAREGPYAALHAAQFAGAAVEETA